MHANLVAIRSVEIAASGALLAVALVVSIALARGGWPGAEHACVAQADCYCEAPRAAAIRQPANTWSCIAGALVAFALAAHSARARARGDALPPGARRRTNRMRADPFYPALYACVVMFSAIAAALFHASLKEWGGKLDMSSMVFSFGFWLTYNAARLFDLSRARFAALYVGLCAALLVPRVVFGVLGFGVFEGLVAAVIASEIALAFRSFELRRGWLWLCLSLYAPALGVWWLSLSGHWLCVPDSLLQGHALWHVLTALSPGALYLYFREGEAP